MVLLSNLKKNTIMKNKKLVDQVSSFLFRKNGKLESQKSWLLMRNYLEELSEDQLKAILKDKPL